MTQGETIRAAVLMAVFGGTVEIDDDENQPADPVAPDTAKNTTTNDTPQFHLTLPSVERIDL